MQEMNVISMVFSFKEQSCGKDIKIFISQAEEDPNSWFSEDTKDFLRSEEPIVEANDQTKVYKFATRTECLPVPHQLSDDECDWVNRTS